MKRILYGCFEVSAKQISGKKHKLDFAWFLFKQVWIFGLLASAILLNLAKLYCRKVTYRVDHKLYIMMQKNTFIYLIDRQAIDFFYFAIEI